MLLLYRHLKIFGSDPVRDVFYGVDLPNKNDGKTQIIAETYQSFADVAPGKLVASTHREGGGWAKH